MGSEQLNRMKQLRRRNNYNTNNNNNNIPRLYAEPVNLMSAILSDKKI